MTNQKESRSRRRNVEYSDVTNETFKKHYPTENWEARFYNAVSH